MIITQHPPLLSEIDDDLFFQHNNEKMEVSRPTEAGDSSTIEEQMNVGIAALPTKVLEYYDSVEEKDTEVTKEARACSKKRDEVKEG